MSATWGICATCRQPLPHPSSTGHVCIGSYQPHPLAGVPQADLDRLTADLAEARALLAELVNRAGKPNELREQIEAVEALAAQQERERWQSNDENYRNGRADGQRQERERIRAEITALADFRRSGVLAILAEPTDE